MSGAKDPGQGSPPGTVLVVEDDPKIASFIDKGLRREGFLVEWVMSGEEALTRLDRQDIDVLVLDLGLPDIDGLEVLREMRGRRMDTPVIVITGRSDPRDRGTALSFGVTSYLTKPFRWVEFLTGIRDARDQVTS